MMVGKTEKNQTLEVQAGGNSPTGLEERGTCHKRVHKNYGQSKHRTNLTVFAFLSSISGGTT